MARCKIIVLSIVSGLLILLSIISVSADPDSTNETTNETTPVENQTCENNTGLIENVTTLNINFITSTLQLLDLNLHLINETLKSHLEEYPFLKPTIEGTDEGIKGVNSILAVLGVNSSKNLNDTNATPNSINETLSQINSTLQYPDGMIENANSTMGESNITTPMIGEMFKSIKTMTTLINQSY